MNFITKAFTLSKKTPTSLSSTVAPQIYDRGADDQKHLVFAACGNSVKVYSLVSGLQTHTLRRMKSPESGALVDVHRSAIIQMRLRKNSQKEYVLVTVCQGGIVAEWSCATMEALSLYKLGELDGNRVKLCAMSQQYIVTYQNKIGLFRVYSAETKSFLG
jgi:hypothetical protein